MLRGTGKLSERTRLSYPRAAVPGLLLLFPLGCACGGDARGGRLVGERKLVREGRPSASRRRGKCRHRGLKVSRFLPSRRVLGRAVMVCAIRTVPSSRVRVLEAGRFGSRCCSWPLWPAEPSRELVVLGLSVAYR